MVTNNYRGRVEGQGGDITCMMCGNVFNLQEGEQDFFAQRGLDQPKRCSSCRAERKAQSGLGRNVPDASAVPQKQITFSEVECDHCHRLALVPFTPREGSDVYCRVCWEGIKNVGVTGATYV